MEIKRNFSHQIVKIVNFKSKILLKSIRIKLYILKLMTFSKESSEKEQILLELVRIIKIF
jgi:hypothetical protein